MKTVVFSTHQFERQTLAAAAAGSQELIFLKVSLGEETAMLASGCIAICIFVNDDASAPVINKLAAIGVKYIVLRSAGFNNVDLKAAAMVGIKVARVPEYSPYAVAEHTVALMLALNRKLIRANTRIHDGNFSLDGLTGFDMHGKTVGIIGLGKIGKVVANILSGFGCKLIAYDPFPDQQFALSQNIQFASIIDICAVADIITLHAPLTEETRYVIKAEQINRMKKGVMIINTSRGGLINSKDVIHGLKSGKIGYLGLDVYEEEKGLFFEDHSAEILQDDVIARLLTFQNVIITSHQGFLTDTALFNIASITVANLEAFENNITFSNMVSS